jgi:hypothetical protein
MTDIVGKTGVVLPIANVIRSVTVPDLEGLIAEYWLGVDGATSKKNRANGGSDLIDLASALAPTYSAKYATVRNDSTLGASRGLDSAIVAPDALTIAVLMRQAQLVNGFNVLRVFGSDNSAIGGIGGPTNGYYSFWNGFPDGAVDEAHVAYGSADTDFHLVVGVGLIGQVGKVYAYNGGVATTDLATRTDAARGATTIKLGGFTTSGYQGQVDVAWAAAFSALKTAAQVDALYASVKAWAQARGLSVS